MINKLYGSSPLVDRDDRELNAGLERVQKVIVLIDFVINIVSDRGLMEFINSIH